MTHESKGDRNSIFRFVVASRNLKAGNEIMSDEPLAIGPMGTSHLLCLTCYKPIISDTFFKCPDCSWPMCSIECSCNKIHEKECEFLMDDKEKVGPPITNDETPRYDVIIILRCLLLKKINPMSWKEILKMESHSTKKKAESDIYHKAAVEYLYNLCGKEYDKDTIHHVRGAITTNCLQVRGPYGSTLRAIYPNIRFFNHSCLPNVYLSSTPEGIMKARASIDIPKYEELNICYAPCDAPFLERQVSLQKSYYFTCNCVRCKDPTELNTYFSNPKCLQCRDKSLIRSTRGSSIVWLCKSCNTESTSDEVEQELYEWLFRLEMNDLFGNGTPFKICSALKMVENSFHSKHYIFLKTCQKALNKLRYNSTLDSLKLKKTIWDYILQIYSALEPGITKRRGKQHQ